MHSYSSLTDYAATPRGCFAEPCSPLLTLSNCCCYFVNTQDLGLVVKCLYALGSTVQATVPEFGGPHLGARIAKANKREWTPEQLAAARLNGAISKQSAGSSDTMERSTIVKTGITSGAGEQLNFLYIVEPLFVVRIVVDAQTSFGSALTQAL
jgi:hypothetical protein